MRNVMLTPLPLVVVVMGGGRGIRGGARVLCGSVLSSALHKIIPTLQNTSGHNSHRLHAVQGSVLRGVFHRVKKRAGHRHLLSAIVRQVGNGSGLPRAQLQVPR